MLARSWKVVEYNIWQQWGRNVNTYPSPLSFSRRKKRYSNGYLIVGLRFKCKRKINQTRQVKSKKKKKVYLKKRNIFFNKVLLSNFFKLAFYVLTR